MSFSCIFCCRINIQVFPYTLNALQTVQFRTNITHCTASTVTSIHKSSITNIQYATYKTYRLFCRVRKHAFSLRQGVDYAGWFSRERKKYLK